MTRLREGARGSDPSAEQLLSRDRAQRILLATLLGLAQGALAAEIPSAADACVGGKAESTPSSDFSAEGDGRSVKHSLTTLEWQRCAVGQDWDAKVKLCTGQPKSLTWDKATKLAAEQKDGWRLPTGAELLTIVEKCHPSPSINTQVFPNTPGRIFWTESSDTGGLERIWSLSFFSGAPYRPGKLQGCSIRLVRGTMQEQKGP